MGVQAALARIRRLDAGVFFSFTEHQMAGSASSTLTKPGGRRFFRRPYTLALFSACCVCLSRLISFLLTLYVLLPSSSPSFLSFVFFRWKSADSGGMDALLVLAELHLFGLKGATCSCAWVS